MSLLNYQSGFRETHTFQRSKNVIQVASRNAFRLVQTLKNNIIDLKKRSKKSYGAEKKLGPFVLEKHLFGG